MARKLSRRQIARYVAGQLLDGGSRDKTLKQLAAYLVDQRRTNELASIVRDIAHHLAQAGVVSATVTSAFELSAATKKLIQEYVKQQTSAKTVTLSEVIDESVLGGIKITTPGKELDMTVAHQLTKLRTITKKL